MKFRFSLLLVFVVLAGAAWARNAVDFSLPDSDGKYVNLSSFRGKYVVLEFMVTTCPHCQAAGKMLQQLQTEYGSQMQVLAVATPGQGVVVLTDYKREHGIAYPVLQGSPKVMMDYIGMQWQSSHVPSFFIISPTGQIVEERNPDNTRDRDFYANPNPRGLEQGDQYMVSRLEELVRKTVPAAARSKQPAGKPAAKKASAKTATTNK